MLRDSDRRKSIHHAEVPRCGVVHEGGTVTECALPLLNENGFSDLRIKFENRRNQGCVGLAIGDDQAALGNGESAFFTAKLRCRTRYFQRSIIGKHFDALGVEALDQCSHSAMIVVSQNHIAFIREFTFSGDVIFAAIPVVAIHRL